MRRGLPATRPQHPRSSDPSRSGGKKPVFRFSIRDVLWFTALAAVVIGWWVDRSTLAWRQVQSEFAAAQLRSRLDAVDAGWRTRTDVPGLPTQLRDPGAWRGYGLGAVLFVIAILIVVFVWRGQVHPSILDDRPRL